MNAEEHRKAAEGILRGLAAHAEYDAQWRTSLATQALAHATLAAIPDPPVIVPDSITLPPPTPYAVRIVTDHDEIYGEMSGADQLPEKIVYQGKDVAYRARHIAEVRAMLDEEPRVGWDKNYENSIQMPGGYRDPLREM